VFTTQVLPKWRDITCLWATPTAEHVPIPVVGGGKGYELRRLPPMLALQAEWIEVGQMVLQEQAPLPPFFAFSGEVKRSEWYHAVSPMVLERSFTTRTLPGGRRQTGQRRRWISPLPTRFGDDPTTLPSLDDTLPTLQSEAEAGAEEEAAAAAAGGALVGGADDGCEYESLPPEVVSASVQYVRRPSQLLAARRLKTIPSNDAVLTAALELTEAAEAEGLRVVKREGRPVVVQLSGDLKLGYNDRKQMAMAVWLSVPDSLREEYVGVLVDEGTSDE